MAILSASVSTSASASVSASACALALPKGGLSLASLDEQILQPGTKGLPITAPLRQGAIGVQGWNVLHGDTSYPVAVLKAAALRHNLDWMQRFCERHGVLLAPHGKTTMSPQLFGAQLANGAWGMTLATAAQVQTAHRFGVRRVLLANQLVARADINAVLALLHGDPDFECLVLADSAAGVARLATAVQVHPLARPLPLLVELGIAGKRAGCRSLDAAMTLARMIAATPGLTLSGVEGYEGLLVSEHHDADIAAVHAYLDQLLALVRQADAEQLFGAEHITVSAGGSSYFDLVARTLGDAGAVRRGDVKSTSRPLRALLRSGCYLTSDHGLYQRHLAQLDEREGHQRALSSASALPATPLPSLQPALEVWSTVLSRPEPQLAILGMGKRDASYDVELPRALFWHRPGPGQPTALPPGCNIVKMNDQHAYLHLPDGAALRDSLLVGDLIGCGISHPCTTFDKWPLLLAVDDDYQVRYPVNTVF